MCPKGKSSPFWAAMVREPQFQGQTKEKLTSAEAARLVEGALRDRFDHFLAGDPVRGVAIHSVDPRTNAQLGALVSQVGACAKRLDENDGVGTPP